MTGQAALLKPPREKAGAATSRAYEFQKHFAMARLLEAHVKGLNYTAWFDHHDDLVFVEADDGPLSFYQVKSDTKAWTPKRLATRGTKGDNPRSVIGKAYYNIAVFGPSLARAAIVSNQMLKATHASGEKSTFDDGEIVLGGLQAKDWKILSDTLAADFTDAVDPACQTLLTFERIPFDLQSFADTLQGRVLTFVQGLGPGAGATALPVYHSLLSEIARCTGDTLKAKTLDELRARKAITRSQVDTLLARVQARTQTPLEWWPLLAQELVQAGLGALAQQRLRQGCLEYWNARNSGVRAAVEAGRVAREAIAAEPGLAQGAVLTCVIAYRTTCALAVPDDQPYDAADVILVELMENPPDV